MINGQIAHLHHQYKLVNPKVNSKTVAERLTRLAEARLPAELSQILDRVLGGQQPLFVLRQVDTSLTLRLGNGQSDEQLVKRWSEKLAGAIVGQLARPIGDSQSMVRFDDQAEFVSCFISDLLNDRAWNTWYYFPFSQWQGRETAVVLQELLHENEADIPAIITRLQAKNQLNILLQKLDTSTIQYVWRQGIQGRHQLTSLASWRPLFATALACIQAFGWVLEDDNEAYFRAYLATNPMTVDWQDRRSLATAVANMIRYFSKQRAINKESNREKEEAGDLNSIDQVLAYLDWLDVDWLRDEILQLDVAITGGENWDMRVRTAVSPIPSSSPPAHTQSSDFEILPTRPLLEPMPRQHKLCADILASLSPDILARLDRSHPDSPVNAVRLFAALGNLSAAHSYLPIEANDIERTTPRTEPNELENKSSKKVNSTDSTSSQPLDAVTSPNDNQLGEAKTESFTQTFPSSAADDLLKQDNSIGEESLWKQPPQSLIEPRVNWQDDSLVANTIQQLLQAWQSLLFTSAPKQTILLLQQGRINTALTMVPQPKQKEAELIFRRIVALGTNGQAVLLRLIGDDIAERINERDYVSDFDTNCAGIFLLLRAVLDSRLPWIVKQANFPGKDPQMQLSLWLMVLGLCWAGKDSIIDGEIDPGVACFAGMSHKLSVTELSSLWQDIAPGDCLQFQIELLRLLIGLRLVQGDELFVHGLPLSEDRSALVLGTAENGGIWPITQIVTGDLTTSLEICISAWTEATGMPLTSVVTDLPLPKDWQDAAVLAPSDAAVAQTFAENRNRLIATYAILENGRLGQPQLDLTVAMTANALLRIWARWLPQFDTASTPYLLQNFIHRSGRIKTNKDEIQITMADKPLDVVLNMTGYLSTLENVSWLDGRHVYFNL